MNKILMDRLQTIKESIETPTQEMNQEQFANVVMFWYTFGKITQEQMELLLTPLA